jgi:predicted DsbA family dithiol-disulfide isomerase
MAALSIDVWSDIACPWCYVGKRRLEAALAGLASPDAIEVTWHAFELNPASPRNVASDLSYAARLAKKYGLTEEQAERRIAQLVAIAREDGLDFRFDLIRPGNTFDAHRLVHFAKERGRQDAMKEQLLRGYLSEGKAIGEPSVLAELASGAGFDADEVSSVLASDSYASAVRADEAEARELGIQGVPFFVFDGRYALSGAQPANVFSQVLERVLSEREASQEFSEGAVCGPEGCA